METLRHQDRILFAPDLEDLRHALPGSEVLLCWNFRAGQLRDAWDLTTSLKWIHWCWYFYHHSIWHGYGAINGGKTCKG